LKASKTIEANAGATSARNLTYHEKMMEKNICSRIRIGGKTFACASPGSFAVPAELQAHRLDGNRITPPPSIHVSMLHD
jgi:hypothetical protein